MNDNQNRNDNKNKKNLNGLLILLGWAVALTVVKDQKVIDDHRQICDAIERRDVAAAQEIMTKHLTRVKVDEASIRQACPEYIKT